MPIQGTVQITGNLAPTDAADSFGTHNDKWGVGGYRIVKTIADRDAIPINESNLLNLDDELASGRRKLGMMVYVSDENKFYVLTIPQATWEGYNEGQKVAALDDDNNFIEFSGGEGGGVLYGNATNDGSDIYITSTNIGTATSYTEGDSYLIKFDVNNTGNSKININSIGDARIYKIVGDALEADDIIAGKIYLITYDGANFQLVTLGGGSSTPQDLQDTLITGNQADGVNIELLNFTAIELDNGSLLRKGTYNFGNIGDVIVTGITDAGTGLIANISGWGDIGGTKWSDLNGLYIKTAVAVTPSGYGDGYQGMHTPVAGTYNYYLQLLGNPSLNGIAYFLAPGNRSGWGADPDDDTNTDPPATYWRLCVLSDWPYTYFTNPSTDAYNFPTTGWVPVDNTIPDSEGGNGYDYIATYDTGFTATLSNILNGNGGISRICSIGYEDMWQAGIRYVFGNSGTIREATNCFNYIPDNTFDVNKRFAVGSRWVLDNGDTYICTDNTSNAATWVKIKVSAGTGGGGVVYYLNFNTAGEVPLTNIPQTPTTTKELGLSGEVTPTSYQSAHLSTGSYDFLASFVTDVGFPSAETIPAGIWDFNIFAESSSTNSANQVYFKVEIYQYDATEALTLLGTSSAIYIYDPAEINQYVASIIVPQTTLIETDRIVVYLYGRSHQNNKDITFHFGGNYPSHVHTTLSSVSGTGFVTVTNGIFDPVASSTINVNKLTAGTANQVIRMPNSDGDPAWGAINLASSAAVTGTLAIGNGGTGFSSYAIGDLLYANTTTSLDKLAGVAAGSVLISNGTNTAPSWSTGPTLRSIILNNATNANTITLNTGATAANYNLTLPIAAPGANQYLQFTSGGVASWVNGTVNGVTTPGAISGTSTANGFTITGSTLNLAVADGTNGGVLSAAANLQTIGGIKTFSSKLIRSGNQSVTSWTTSGQAFDSAASTYTDTSTAAAGTVASRALNTFNQPTLASTNAITVTNAANVYIANAPTAGTNTTITNTHSLWVAAGQSRFDGNLVTGSTSLSVFNTTATTLNIYGAATNFTLGGTPTTALNATLFGNATVSGATKTINIGTAGLLGSTTNINIGSAVVGALGTTTLSNAVTMSAAGSATAAQLTFSGTANSWISFSGLTGAAPTFTNRSTGTKIVLYPYVGANTLDWAIGWTSGVGPLWLTSPGLIEFYAHSGGGVTSPIPSGNFQYSSTVRGLNLNAATDATATIPQLLISGGTASWMRFGDTGGGPPTLASRSLGTRIVLRSAVGSNTFDWAIGYTTGPGPLWFTSPVSIQFYTNNSDTVRATINSTGLTLGTGSVLTIGANQVVGAKATGWATPTGTLQRTALTDASTATDVLRTLQALVTDLRTHGLI